ncbi:hypothetical protein [Actinoplanes sp. NPDC049118]|uniref:hypothetical protein n=1 Tax=Actinoplanes sp. NPDC049118 TaxID=3155769 RepID=UPI00340BDC72
MRTTGVHRRAAIGALALTVVAHLAGCGGEALSPLPGQAAAPPPSASAAGVPAPSTEASATAGSPPRTTGAATTRPARTRSRTAEPEPEDPSENCLGAVRYRIDLQSTEIEMIRSMCFHTGGTLRLQSIGPGLVTATPEDLVDPRYEAGVQDLRFLRAGTVTVTIPQDERTYTITVVVVD